MRNVIFEEKNVFDAALDRIRFLFDEFEEIVVEMSGGKDSTVVFNLCLQVARERNRLPIRLFFIDQEAEWTHTITYIRKLMSMEEVIPMWFQMPIQITNATSSQQNWLQCWEEGGEWLREKEDISIKENIYGTKRFHKLFDAIFSHHFKGIKFCALSGMRASESHRRWMGVTHYPTYKHITWGRHSKGKHSNNYTFFPIYDWETSDVWAAILKNGWEYNKIYDYQYRYGVPLTNMRVSNLHHETAIKSLFYLQEVDPILYDKLAKRLHGIDTANKMNKQNYYVKKLPYMFKDWEEYCNFLIQKLIQNEEFKKNLNKYITKFKTMFKDDKKNFDKSMKAVVSAVLHNDLDNTKLDNFLIAHRTRLSSNTKQEEYNVFQSTS